MCAWNRRRRSSGERRTGDGAPYDVWEGVSVKPALSVIQRKGRRGRRPLRWLRDAGFSEAVRCSLSQPLRCMPQARFR